MIRQSTRGYKLQARPRRDRACRSLSLVVLCGAVAASMLACARPRPMRPALLVAENPFVSRLDQVASGEGRRESSASVRGSAALREPSRFCVDRLVDPIGLGEDDTRVAGFQTLLIEGLEGEGFDVTGPEDVEKTWERVRESSEPIYDPYTGRRVEHAFEAARGALFDAVVADFGCDFRLSPSIRRVSASWRDGIARWDGASEQLTPHFGWNMNAPYGYVDALSFHVRIVDEDDVLVYFGTGGIQLLGHLPDGFSGEYVSIEAVGILADPELNRAAIRRSLEQMRDGSNRDD